MRGIGLAVHGRLENHDSGVLLDDAVDPLNGGVHGGVIGLHHMRRFPGHFRGVMAGDGTITRESHRHTLVTPIQRNLDRIDVDDQVAFNRSTTDLDDFALLGFPQLDQIVLVFGVEILELVEGRRCP